MALAASTCQRAGETTPFRVNRALQRLQLQLPVPEALEIKARAQQLLEGVEWLRKACGWGPLWDRLQSAVPCWFSDTQMRHQRNAAYRCCSYPGVPFFLSLVLFVSCISPGQAAR